MSAGATPSPVHDYTTGLRSGGSLDEYLACLKETKLRLRELFVATKHKRRTVDITLSESTVCWLCCDPKQYVECSLYDRYPLCEGCGKQVLLSIVLPHVCGAFQHNDKRILEIIQNYLSGDVIPAHREVHRPWSCPKCTLENEPAAEMCAACNGARPLLVCPLCRQDVTTTVFCHSSRSDHITWTCENCSKTSLDNMVVCDGCWTSRKWYCALCGSGNDYNADACGNCAARDRRLSSKGSYIRRKEIVEMGLDADEAAAEAKKAADYQRGIDRLDQRLAEMGFEMVTMNADGNCLFSALAFQLFRNTSLHFIVRQMVVDYMSSHSAEFVPFIGQGLADYLATMRVEGVWGDELTLQASAQLFFATVHVVASDEKNWYHCYKPSATDSPLRHVVVAYVAPVHYQTCRIHKKDVAVPVVPIEELFIGKTGAVAAQQPSRERVSSGHRGDSSPSNVIRVPVYDATRRSRFVPAGLDSSPSTPQFHVAPPQHVRERNDRAIAMPSLMEQHSFHLPASSVAVESKRLSDTEPPPAQRISGNPTAFVERRLVSTTLPGGISSSSSSLPYTTYQIPISIDGHSTGGSRAAATRSTHQQPAQMREIESSTSIPRPVPLEIVTPHGTRHVALRSAEVSLLPHPVTVQVQMAGAFLALGPLSRDGYRVVLHPEASYFYCHPIERHMGFALQSVTDGNFLRVSEVSRKPDRAAIVAPLVVAPLHSGDALPFTLKLFDVRDGNPNTNNAQFLFDECSYVVAFGQSVYASSDPNDCTPIILLLGRWGQRPARLCIKCSQWYDFSEKQRTPHSCAHWSYADEGELKLNRATSLTFS